MSSQKVLIQREQHCPKPTLVKWFSATQKDPYSDLKWVSKKSDV